jgi:hypothetical protein
MGKRKTQRLAFWGEYVSPDTEISEEVYRARLELMKIVKQVFPNFLKKLSQRCVSAVRAARKGRIRFRSNPLDEFFTLRFRNTRGCQQNASASSKVSLWLRGVNSNSGSQHETAPFTSSSGEGTLFLTPSGSQRKNLHFAWNRRHDCLHEGPPEKDPAISKVASRAGQLQDRRSDRE